MKYKNKNNLQSEGARKQFILFATVLPSLSCGGVGYLAFTAFNYLFFPQKAEITRIYDFCVLMAFEFILVIMNWLLSSLAGSKKIVFWLVVLLFFVPFIYSFSRFMIDVTLMIKIIAPLLITHFIDLFSRISKKGKRTAENYYIYRIALYFLLLMFGAFANSIFPKCGLSDSFLASANYESINKGSGGLFCDEPNVAVTLGLLYFGILSLSKLYTIGKSLYEILFKRA